MHSLWYLEWFLLQVFYGGEFGRVKSQCWGFGWIFLIFSAVCGGESGEEPHLGWDASLVNFEQVEMGIGRDGFEEDK